MGKPRVLIVYPISTIKASWEQDLNKWGYETDIKYTTTASLWKIADKKEVYDLIIVDEIHLLSEANLEELNSLISAGNRQVLGLSGTISFKTQLEIRNATGLKILADYPIDQAIKEGVISDYEINIIIVPLDNKTKYICPSKKMPAFKVTEQARYDFITKEMEQEEKEIRLHNAKIIEKATKSGTLADPSDLKTIDYGFRPLQRMHLINGSIGRKFVVKSLLERRFQDSRVLVFCGLTDVADSLDIPVYHSKNKDEKVKKEFCEGNGKHLATVDMFEAGVTVKPINTAIIASVDSNPENLTQRISRLTGYEYDNPEKIAKIYIVCTDTVEKKWLSKALEFFDPSKIKTWNV